MVDTINNPLITSKMKKRSYLLLLFSVAISISLSGQDITRTTSIESNQLTPEILLSKINSSSVATASEVVTDSFLIREPRPLTSHTRQDSLNLQYDEFTLVKKTTRLNAEQISAAFPEIVNYDRDDNPIVDYTSLITYLLLAVNEQQEEIEALKTTISELNK